MANFIELKSVEDLAKAIEGSIEKPILLFKHSTTCPISHGVYNTVSELEGDIYLVVVQRVRNVSNAIAELTGVRHESPQAIVIDKKTCSYNASHYDIEAKQIEKHL